MIDILSIFFLVGSLPLLFYRMIKGPRWADRILAADLFTIYLIAGLFLLKIGMRWPWDQDAIWLFLAIGLVGFIAVGILTEESHG